VGYAGYCSLVSSCVVLLCAPRGRAGPLAVIGQMPARLPTRLNEALWLWALDGITITEPHKLYELERDRQSERARARAGLQRTGDLLSNGRFCRENFGGVSAGYEPLTLLNRRDTQVRMFFMMGAVVAGWKYGMRMRGRAKLCSRAVNKRRLQGFNSVWHNSNTFQVTNDCFLKSASNN
jgi:hypothetical protein